ncbi:peptide methionine sulfoxide reductase MsrA [Cypionkella aquatica]|uniref:Peptide methionine sulfoxide reductase MsrA n=1 Tax=Cypionkella aquatica TaxID=1756042 RepID=A0AA37TRC5_9RHOB|nr:peptide-methionine (S)-S-oxide reductase MsrA [Cypionkella aquatica]GLS86197.1 peptide methionine sulfoxide reductase MsrA [Cypionkella aquatica]
MQQTFTSPEPTAPRRRLTTALALIALLGGGAILLPTTASFAGEGVLIPAPALDQPASTGTQTAIFAGGCFWGVQGVFQHVDGVISATSGYTGGADGSPNYESVSAGSTGHAEAVKIVYDPSKVSYGDLLHIFFSVVADPTTLNYQGPDHGTQYRTAIFPTNAAQAKITKAYIAQLNAAKVFPAAIVTTIEPQAKFFVAEDYHQDFLTQNPTYPYIVINDLPKVADLKVMFPDDYRKKPVLVMN